MFVALQHFVKLRFLMIFVRGEKVPKLASSEYTGGTSRPARETSLPALSNGTCDGLCTARIRRGLDETTRNFFADAAEHGPFKVAPWRSCASELLLRLVE